MFNNFLYKNIYKKSCYILISYDKHFLDNNIVEIDIFNLTFILKKKS
jgi:hypothetical protein